MNQDPRFFILRVAPEAGLRYFASLLAKHLRLRLVKAGVPAKAFTDEDMFTALVGAADEFGRLDTNE